MSLISIRSSVTSSVNKFLKKQDTHDGGATAAGRHEEPAQLSTGFICPDCMQSFFTAQGLSVHFEEAHGIKMDGSKASPQIAKASSKAPVAPSVPNELLELDVSSANLEQLRSSIIGLRSAVKEERLYSTAVKQQMERVDISASRKVQMKEEELKTIKKMFEEAEESRMRVKNEVDDLKSVITILKEGSKEKIVQKAAELAIERANLRSQLDDTLSRNIGLGENVTQLQDTVIARENECKTLQVQLDSRPQNDDVAALRQQMARLHETMDTAADLSRTELEKASAEHGATREELSGARQQISACEEREAQLQATADASAAEVKRLEVRCHDLRRGLDKAPTRDELTQLSDKAKELQQQLESAPASSTVKRLEAQCSQLQGELKSRPTQLELDSQTERANHLAQQLEQAPKVSDVERLHAELGATKEQLSQAPTSGVLAEYESKISVLSGQLEVCPKQEDLRRVEDELQRVRSELSAAPNPEQLTAAQSSLTEALSLSRQQQEQLQSKEAMIASLDSDLRQAQGSLSERESALAQVREDLAKANTVVRDEATSKGAMQEEKRSLQRQFQETSTKLEQVREELSGCKDKLADSSAELKRFESERKELIAQIEAGEGTGAAIQQLTQDKESLYQQRIELEAKMQAQLTQHVEKVEEEASARNSLLEELSDFKMKTAGQQKEIEDLSANVTSAKEKISALQQDVVSQTSDAQTLGRQKDTVEGQLQQTQANLLQSEQQLKRLQDDLAAARSQLSSSQAELSGVRAELSSSNSVLAEKKELLVASDKQLSDLRVAHATVTEQLHQGQRQAEELKATHASLVERHESEAVELRTKLQSLQLESEKKSLEAENLQQSCDQSAGSVQALETRLREQLELHEKAQVEHADVLTRSRLEKESVEAESVAAISSVKAELESKVAAMAGVRRQLENSIREKTSLEAAVAAKDQMIAEKRSEVEHLTSKLTKAQEAAKERDVAHQKELTDVQEKVAEAQKTADSGKADKLNMSVELAAVRDELAQKKKQLAAMEEEKLAVAKKLTGGEKEAQGLKDSLQASRDECSKLQDQLSQSKRLLKESKQKLQFEQERANAVQGQMVEVDSQLQSVTESSKKKERKFSQDLEAKEAVLLSLQKKLEASQAELKKPCQSCLNYERQVCRLQSQIKNIEQTVEALQAELDGARSDFGDLNSQIDSRESQLASVEKESSDTIKRLTEMKDKLNKQVTDLTEELAVQKEVFGVVSDEKDQSDQLLMAKEGVIIELTKTRSSLEKDVASLTQSTNAANLAREKDLAETQKARDLFIGQKVELQHKVDALNDEMHKHRAQAAQERADADAVASTLASQLATLRVELSQAEEKKVSIVDEMSNLTARHHMNIETLNGTLSALQSETQGMQAESRRLKTENERLQGDVAELDCAVGNIKDERKQLLDRCLASEEEVELLQGKVVVLRKQVDDSTAALHDMGQLAQTLQVDVSKYGERSWESDREAINCKRCKVKFSVTVRKHHCRNCGSIFCQPCTAHTAKLPSIKKPARVCDSCYRELTR